MGTWKKSASKVLTVLTKKVFLSKKYMGEVGRQVLKYWVHSYFMNGIKYGCEEVSVVVRGRVL